MTAAARAYQKASTRRFRKWWAGIHTHTPARQAELISNWLKYAKKTTALRGDQNRQAVVYAIDRRYRNSQWPQLSRANALTVFLIVNQHQENYRSIKHKLRAQWVAEIQGAVPGTQTATLGNVTVRHTTNRRVISGGRA